MLCMSSGVALSSQCPGMLMTAGADGKLKTWDILDGMPSLVYSQEQKLGALLCLEACPDLPFIACLGGENKNHNFTVVDAMDIFAGELCFIIPITLHYFKQFYVSLESSLNT